MVQAPVEHWERELSQLNHPGQKPLERALEVAKFRRLPGARWNPLVPEARRLGQFAGAAPAVQNLAPAPERLVSHFPGRAQRLDYHRPLAHRQARWSDQELAAQDYSASAAVYR